uniref:Endonuclease/exonuclease/phosphatase family protein n=1 Tax=Marseillevirus LCMAC101 TaxID=2506602 RepID=A0A481YRR5_9VIRU|nr:MAG: endonuclease/exonuclease/phosphatase family protein [Marseillevirus LCMAC101]
MICDLKRYHFFTNIVKKMDDMKIEDISEIREEHIVSFLTYNIDGRVIDSKDRLDLALDQIRELHPDVVAIQEGTYLTYEKLFREMGQMGYKKNFSDEVRQRKFGEIIFSRRPIVKIEYLPFRYSYECRGLTRYLITIGDEKVWFLTTQFEFNIAIRRKQMVQMESFFLRLSESTIFGGDTQIQHYQKIGAPEEWLDAWYELGSPETEYTVDWKNNYIIQPPLRDRPDRVWYKAKDSALECLEFELIGKDKEDKASGHFGVYTTFRVGNDKIKKRSLE